ncbi:hypothetical protein AU510_12365 [Lonsdalea britannica]|uniref:DUF4760 domain-containing protein n=1 Tax=Lonsdalea britannica TaxID=1082704 RepID=UPI000A1D9429|nr:DUF4760 domain-containing protein [Lonsdalea britannica]OSN04210.1 hypothetical protein AU510_12365 [Lonsdalea britannica]
MNQLTCELLTSTFNFLKDTLSQNPTFYPGVAGALIAFFGIRNQRKTSREKNSLDFEAAYKRSADVRNAWKILLRIEKNRLTVPLSHWGKKESAQSDESIALKIIFNEWERCANAVNNNLYDDNYLYKVYGSTLIFLDIHFEPYMQECRKRNPRFYRNLKCLALKWRVRRSMEGDSVQLTREYKKKLRLAHSAVKKLNVKY